MSSQAQSPDVTGDVDSSIYDLGYQRYEGERIGRKQAIKSIYVEGLRGVFGLGRSTSAKLAPWGLVLIAILPAIAFLAMAILFGGEIDSEDIFEHSDYFSLVSMILALFVAIVGPDLVGRDRRSRTLSLYFSRALSRFDYAAAKYAAMLTALLMLTLLPQAVLYFGNALVVDSFGDYIQDESDQILPIIVGSLAISGFLAAVALFVSSQTQRRTFATVGVILVMVAGTIIAGIMTDIDAGPLSLFVYLSPIDIVQGSVAFLFDIPLEEDSSAALAGYEPFTYLIAAAVYSVAGFAMVVRSYSKIQA